VGYLFGGAAPAQFTDETARSRDVVGLRRRVRAVLDASFAKDECFVVVTTPSGARHEHHVVHATGSVDSPMTDEQLRGKCALLLAATHADRAGDLYDVAIGIDALDSLDPLFAASQPTVSA
jgi:2-methylcitrate dehydratase PrpD